MVTSPPPWLAPSERHIGGCGAASQAPAYMPLPHMHQTPAYNLSNVIYLGSNLHKLWLGYANHQLFATDEQTTMIAEENDPGIHPVEPASPIFELEPEPALSVDLAEAIDEGECDRTTFLPCATLMKHSRKTPYHCCDNTTVNWSSSEEFLLTYHLNF